MSEDLMTTVRIIELTTQAGVEIIKLGYHCSLASYRKMRDIYHAHVLDQAGEMTYSTLLKHIGSDTQIIDFATENGQEIEKIKVLMTEYKISFVTMPDMCAGDGHTQFMIDASDASKVAAMLRKITNIDYAYLSGDEYGATGTKEQWDELHKKATEAKKHEQTREPPPQYEKSEIVRDIEEPSDIVKAETKKESNPDLTTGKKNAERMTAQKIRIETMQAQSSNISMEISPAAQQFRRSEIYRETRMQPGVMRMIFRPEDAFAETGRMITFHIPATEKLFSISKDYVQKERGRYYAVIKPEMEYFVLPEQAFTGAQDPIGKTHIRTDLTRMSGDSLMALYQEARATVEKRMQENKAKDFIRSEVINEPVRRL